MVLLLPLKRLSAVSHPPGAPRAEAGAVARFTQVLRRAGLGLAAWLVAGCATVLPQSQALREGWPEQLQARTELTAVPFYPQRDYECGPAALAMTLAFAGIPVTPEVLVPKVYVPARKGTLQVEMLAAPRAYDRVSWQLAPRLQDVLRELDHGNPVIVLQDYGVWPVRLWHYAVVVGYDRERQEVVLRSGEKERLSLPFAALEYTWRKGAHWAMVVVPPDRIPATATEAGWEAAVAAMERVSSRSAARTAYRTLLARWPASLTGAIGLGNVAYAEGDLVTAEQVLRGAVERHGSSDVALNNLAQVLADQGRRAEALALVDRAVAVDGPFRAAAERTRAQIQGPPEALRR